jgi:asparagine synthase (glutamine-hydrolysing)
MENFERVFVHNQLMPGITGIIANGSPPSRVGALQTMTQCLVREPFYKSGSYSNVETNLLIGWTCHAGSFSDCLPVWNESRDVCLIFSGEDFADEGIVADLKFKGHAFEPGNASYLVHLYEERGLPFLETINGWFSGLLLDLREQKIVLFNDRYGMNRIYYHENGYGFYFSSEAKSLLKILPELRQLDPQGLGEFLSCGCVLQNRTFFPGISLLPGGSAWVFSPGQPVRKEAYFRKETWEEQPLLNDRDYFEKLRETWAQILTRYFNGPERAALSLTGGVDSRMILACAPCLPGTLPCYTFGGMYRDCADVTISRRAAEICRQPHEAIALSRDFFSEFPALVERVVYLTDGTLDPTGAADLFVNRIARKKSPVRVTGLNGGEILRSLVMFKPGGTSRWAPLVPPLKEHIEAAAMTYAREIRGNRLSFIAFKQAPWYLHARLAIERSQLTIRTPYFDNDLVALSFRAPPEMRGIEPALRLIAEGNPALEALATDRASRLRSIPGITFARHQLQEFTFKAEYAYDYGMPQWLARLDHLFALFHFERLFLGRHKFYHFRVWYRDELSGYLREVLLDSRARGRSYLDGAGLERLVLAHTAGRANYTTEIHKLLTLELLQRQMIDQG